MSDQFNKDPENDLPDWLKKLRNRGSFNADEKPKDEIPKEEEKLNEYDQQLDSSEEIDSAIPLPKNEAGEEFPNAEEPDWLKEIRERHQQDIENTEISEPPAEQAIEDDELFDDELLEIADSQWAAPLDDSEQTPILEVPIEPSSKDESEDPISQDSEKSDDLENEMLEESGAMADEILEDFDEGIKGIVDEPLAEDADSHESASENEPPDQIDADAKAESDAEIEQFLEAIGEEDKPPPANVEPTLDDKEFTETVESSDSEEDDLLPAEDEPPDLIDADAEAESDAEAEQFSEELGEEDELPPADVEPTLNAEEIAETIESSDSEEDDLLHAEDEPIDLIDGDAEAESDADIEQFSEEIDEEAQLPPVEDEFSLDDGDTAETINSSDAQDESPEIIDADPEVKSDAEIRQFSEEMGEEDESPPAEDEFSLDDGDTAETIENLEAEEGIPPENEIKDELSKDEGQETDELISWLEKVEEEEDEKENGSPIQPSNEERDLSPAELPTWLAALKPEEDQDDLLIQDSDGKKDIALAFEEKAQEDTQELGPLAGLKGIIPTEPEVVQQARAKIRTGKLEFSANQQQHVANLESVLAKEGAPIEDRSKGIALPMRILQLLFAALLFIATLFPLISGSSIASRPIIGSIPESTAFYNQIELLPANVPILVAFDVQPALYGEMKPLVSTVLGHFLEKEAHLIFISTQPTGPALIERLLSEELNDVPSVANGDYVNLGYLSGGTAALRYFASNPREATLLPQLWDSAGLENISSITDFGIVLTIASDAEDARAWIEQVSPFTSDGIFALSSAQAAPLLMPYLTTDPVTIRSLVAGLKGAAYYESLRGIEGLGRSYWDAYSFGLGSIVVLIILGGLYGRLIQLRPENEAARKEAKKSDE